MSNRRISRRTVLGSVSAASLTPALAVVHPDSGLVRDTMPSLLPAFVTDLALADARSPAANQQHFDVAGGRIDGPRLRGIVQSGRLECDFDATGHLLGIDARLLLRTDQGRVLLLRDHGMHALTAAPQRAFTSRPELLAPEGDVTVLAAVLVGRWSVGRRAADGARLTAFEVR